MLSSAVNKLSIPAIEIQKYCLGARGKINNTYSTVFVVGVDDGSDNVVVSCKTSDHRKAQECVW